MDLRQMRYFVAVARERNFTRAAESLHIAQPPLSRQIQLLEEELGVTLILRKTRPVRLTDAGRLFYEQSLQVLGRIDQIKEATSRIGSHRNQVLSIGFVASTLYGGLPALVKKLRQRAPHLDIQVVELLSVQQIAALSEGRIDLGFARLGHNDPNVASTVLRDEPLVVALPCAHPLAQGAGPLPLQALAGERLILYPKEPRPSYADQVMGILHQAGLQPADLFEVREIQTALGLVAAEFGLCVVPVSAQQMRSDLTYRRIDSPKAVSPVVLNHRAGDTSEAIALVKELIAEIYAERPPWLVEAAPPVTGAADAPLT